MTVILFPLIDGALYSDPRAQRQQIVEEMARRLLIGEAFRNEADALKSLLQAQRWSAFQILNCIDDARQVAAQDLVAQVMGDS
ncbi:hypothetical protein ACRAVF_26990 [Bradyrhizobium oligotrophicum S58]